VIDGANRLQVFWHVILPLSRAGMTTVIILEAMACGMTSIWRSYSCAKWKCRRFRWGLLGFFQQHTIIWPKFLAGLVIITVPVVVIYIVGQKQFVKGVTANAIKG